MGRVKEIERVMDFEELSEDAKEKARDWYRAGLQSETFHFEYVVEDAKTIGALMGIDIGDIFYSVSYSQGDGACFQGSYRYKEGSVEAVKGDAPLDKELHRIVEALHEIQKKNDFGLTATVKQRGHYQHSGCTDIEVSNRDSEEWPSEEVEGEIKEALRDYMDWIFKALVREDECQNSDEAVDENITANEYKFLEDGRRATEEEEELYRKISVFKDLGD